VVTVEMVFTEVSDRSVDSSSLCHGDDDAVKYDDDDDEQRRR
jgi:hypothetical protein